MSTPSRPTTALLALIAAALVTASCGTPKYVEIGPARADSYACTQTKVYDLGLEIYEEDVEGYSFKAIRRTNTVVDDREAVSYDELQVEVKDAGTEGGQIRITVTAGILWSEFIAETENVGGVSTVNTEDQPATARGVRDAQTIMDECAASR